VRSTVQGTPLVAALLPMTGVAFLLFSFYMITDPATSPASVRGQVAFGLAVAMVYGLLLRSHVVFTLFFALTVVCALRGLTLLAMAALRTSNVGVKPTSLSRVPVSLGVYTSSQASNGSASSRVVPRPVDTENVIAVERGS
jgi:enediyne biosynthesis protein E5